MDLLENWFNNLTIFLSLYALHSQLIVYIMIGVIWRSPSPQHLLNMFCVRAFKSGFGHVCVCLHFLIACVWACLGKSMPSHFEKLIFFYLF